jgi:hypothetical protein
LYKEAIVLDEVAVSLGEIWSLANFGVFDAPEVDFLEDFEFETTCFTSVSRILVSTLNEPVGNSLVKRLRSILTAKQFLESMVIYENEYFLNFPSIERMCDNPFTRIPIIYIGRIFSS